MKISFLNTYGKYSDLKIYLMVNLMVNFYIKAERITKTLTWEDAESMDR